MATPDLIRLDIVVDEEQYDTVAGLLVRNISYGWEEDSLPTGETRFRVHCDNAIVQENLLSALRAWLPGLDVEQTSIPRQDWTVAWREFFTPVRAGQFIVLPPWLFESTPLEGRKPIIIEPKSAFGTGHHNTTVLCLEAITELLASGRLKAGQRFFDVGTGSGILGIACCLNGLGRARLGHRSGCRGQRPRERGHQQGGRRFPHRPRQCRGGRRRAVRSGGRQHPCRPAPRTGPGAHGPDEAGRVPCALRPAGRAGRCGRGGVCPNSARHGACSPATGWHWSGASNVLGLPTSFRLSNPCS